MVKISLPSFVVNHPNLSAKIVTIAAMLIIALAVDPA
jgi:hypothetical protein